MLELGRMGDIFFSFGGWVAVGEEEEACRFWDGDIIPSG